MKRTEDKIVYLELIRIIALFMIMWNHTYENGFMYFLQCGSSKFYMVYIALSVLCKAGVPLFFMVSGFLLLGREESFEFVFRKRIIRIILIICLYTFGYMLYYGKDIQDVWKYFFSECVTESEWFLFFYLAFLIVLPFLQKMVANFRETDYKIIIVIAIAALVIGPIVEYFGGFQFNPNFNVSDFLQWNILYPIMGYYWGKKTEETKVTRKSVGIAVGLGFGILAICSILVAYRLDKEGIFLDGLFHKNGLPIITVVVFWIIRYIGVRIKWDKLKKAIAYVGSCTFGVYLLEPILREKTILVCHYCTIIGINQVIASFIWILAAMSVGIIVVGIIKKIPYVNKLL